MGVYLSRLGFLIVARHLAMGPLLAVRRGGFLRLQGLVTCSLDYHSKLSRFLEPFQPFPFRGLLCIL